MALKTERFLYVSRNETTGLADVVARIYRDGSLVASNVALTELDATNAPGIYVLSLSAATLSGYGGSGHYEVQINSATKPAMAVTKRYIVASNTDDLETHLASQDTTLSTIETSVTATQGHVESATYGLSALKTLIDTVQNAVGSIQNNTRFSASMPSPMIKPLSGSTTFRIPINLFDTSGNPEDPDSNSIKVKVVTPDGTDRSSLLAGYVALDGDAPAVRTAEGLYYIDLTLPFDATEEQLIFEFSYAEASVAFTQRRVSQVMNDVQAEGLALETTAQDILTDTADMQPRVADIQTKVNDATYGLSALKALIDILDTNVDANKATLENATYGLAAVKTALDLKASQVSVDAIQTDVTAVKGAGFDSATDSLRALSQRLYTGGTVI